MDRLIAISLLVQLGIAAAIASALVRSKEFKTLLFAPVRTTRQMIYLVLWICIPFSLGVVVRLSTPNFLAADLSFEAAILMGMVGGPLAGLLGSLGESVLGTVAERRGWLDNDLLNAVNTALGAWLATLMARVAA